MLTVVTSPGPHRFRCAASSPVVAGQRVPSCSVAVHWYPSRFRQAPRTFSGTWVGLLFSQGIPHLYAVAMTQLLAPPTNALALAGFILGLLAVALAAIPDARLLALVPGLLAVIFGFVGVNTANRSAGKRRKLAILSVVLGFSPLWLPWILVALFGV